MKILGIDPGLASCGVAVIENNKLHKCFCITTTNKAIRTNQNKSEILRGRLHVIQEKVTDTIYGTPINFAALEMFQGSKSTQAVRAMSAVIAMLWTVLDHCAIPVVDISPLEAKVAAVGERKASKYAMQVAMADRYLPLGGLMDHNPKKNREHMADACAVAYAASLRPEIQAAARL